MPQGSRVLLSAHAGTARFSPARGVRAGAARFWFARGRLARAPQGATPSGPLHGVCERDAGGVPAHARSRASQDARVSRVRATRRRAACPHASEHEPRKEPVSARERDRRRRPRERATADEHVGTSRSPVLTGPARSPRAQVIAEVDASSYCLRREHREVPARRSRRGRRGGTIVVRPAGAARFRQAARRFDAASEQVANEPWGPRGLLGTQASLRAGANVRAAHADHRKVRSVRCPPEFAGGPRQA